ncbi:MAG: Ldh family oxidoreductase [Planctomycetota bacterium]
MAGDEVPRIRVPLERIEAFVRAAFERLGVDPAEAGPAAVSVAASDLRENETHGLWMMPYYVSALKSGQMNPKPKFRIDREGPAFALVDADNAFGLVTGRFAMNLAIRKAAEAGIAAVSVRNSNSLGYLGWFAGLAAEKRMIGIVMSNFGRPAVAPPDGLTRLVATNPIAIAAPGRHEAPFLLDISTSVVSEGKSRIAKARGKRLPCEWVQDAEGRPSTDPDLSGPGPGSTRPLGVIPEHGAYKGFGLALAVDILCGLLSGGVYGNYRERLGLDPVSVNSSSHFFLAINATAFRPDQELMNDMDMFLAVIRRSLPRPGVDHVRYPGLRAFEAEKANRKNGVPLAKDLLERMAKIAKDLGVPALA